MKKLFKNILAVLFVLSVGLIIFSCKGKEVSNVSETKETVIAPDGSTIEKGQGGNILVMSTNAEFPPYEFKDNNEFLGIDVEIARQIGNKLGKKIEIMDIAFDSIIPSVMGNKADFAMAGMTVTEDRLQSVDFSHTYATAIQSVIVMNDGKIKSLDDLQDKLIGVQGGTTSDIYSTDDFGDEHVSRYNRSLDAVQALKAGRIDAVMVDNQVAVQLVEEANAGSNDLIILDTPYAEEEYAIAVKKGNKELLDKINEAIDGMKNDGTIDNIISKYIK